MRNPLIFSILFSLAYAKSHTIFDRVELQTTYTDASGCAECPSGQGTCAANAVSRVVKCTCPGSKPAFYDGNSMLENHTQRLDRKHTGRWKVWDRSAGMKGMVEGQRLEHKARECRVFVDEYNELHTDVKLECMRGEFVYLPDALAVYSCKFGDMAGRLFVHANGTEATTSSTVTANKSNSHNFELIRTILRDRSNSVSTEEGSRSSFTVENGIISIRGLFEDASKEFAVTGFYCIIEHILPKIIPDVPHTYSYTSPFKHGHTNDLRAIDRVTNNTYNVTTCVECKGHGQPYACEPYVAERNKNHGPTSQWECAEGEFTYHNSMGGLYTCDSGKNKGYLFVHNRHEDYSYCPSEHSNNYSIGVKSYYLAYEKTNILENMNSWFEGKLYGSYKASRNNRIMSRAHDCLVIGLYCIIEKDKTAYSPEMPGNLRVPNSNYREVSNCTECFHGQVCMDKNDTFDCFCREYQLSFYPNPRHHKALSYNSEASCKNTYFIGTDRESGQLVTAYMQEFPLLQKKEGCEEYADTPEIVQRYGNMTCFLGDFGYHPVHKGIYTCNFGTGSGYLYIETAFRDNIDLDCQHDRTYDLAYGVKSFILHKEKGARRINQEIPEPHFYAKDNSIYLDHCLVVGMYCLKLEGTSISSL